MLHVILELGREKFVLVFVKCYTLYMKLFIKLFATSLTSMLLVGIFLVFIYTGGFKGGLREVFRCNGEECLALPVLFFGMLVTSIIISSIIYISKKPKKNLE